MRDVAGPRGLRKLVEAMLLIGSNLDLKTVLGQIVESARDLVDARYGALGVLDETGTYLTDFITVGMDEETHLAIGDLPKGGGVLGALISDAWPLRIPDLLDHPLSFGFPPNHPPMRSFLGVPVRVGDSVFGNLYLTEKQSAEVFTDVDEELVVGLASAAGIAIEKTRLHEQLQRVALLEDRERMARDLHDSVIQRIFGAGLQLQGTSSLVHRDPDGAVARIDTVIDQLDLTVKDLRSAIFGLHTTTPGSLSGVRARLSRLTGEAAAALGFAPKVRFDGLVDTRISEPIAHEIAAVLTEALSNATRHSQASRVEVCLIVDDAITLRIEDDGVGPPPSDAPRGNGLDNMAARALCLDGAFSMTPRDGGGTIVEWCVPLDGT